MKVELNDFAALLAAAIWADGEYAEAEATAVEEIADAFELDVTELKSAVEAEIEKIKDFDEEAMRNYLNEAASGVAREDAMPVFEAILQIVIVDNVFTRDEAENLLFAADALDIDTEEVLLLIADLVRSEPDLEVKFN
ncbi:MAG: TerB family tellurite resistance protein [Muribaculaceae bacterium]